MNKKRDFVFFIPKKLVDDIDDQIIRDMIDKFEDKDILDVYMSGFHDELWNLEKKEFSEPILTKAYEIGCLHAILGDDIHSVDYLSNEEILNIIKNGTT